MPLHMTSNTTPPPLVASASSQDSPQHSAFMAFDDNSNFAWFTQIGDAIPAWIQIDLGAGRGWNLATYTVVVEDIVSIIFDPGAVLKDWTVEGSDDDATWNVLDTRTDQNFFSIFDPTEPFRRTYTCAVTGVKYRYFRMNITANHGSSRTGFSGWDFVAQFNRIY